MGVINDVYETVLALRGANTDGGNQATKSRELHSAMGRMNSITKKAKDAIHTYPVIFSETVLGSDEDLVFAINGYLETQFAVFTMIAMGLNPVIGDGNSKVQNHVMQFYSKEDMDGDVEVIESTFPDMVDRYPRTIKSKITAESLKEFSLISLEAEKKNNNDSSKIIKLTDKVRVTDPTLLEVNMYLDNETGTKVKVPIAVKAMPHNITSEEATRVFENISNDRPVAGLIKILSGEVSLIKDVLLQMDRSSKDKKLYQKLGRHPSFRRLLSKRRNSRLRQLVNFWIDIDKVLPGAQELPITSLVVTKDELQRGYGSYWKSIRKDLDGFMDKTMLLSLVIVDTDTGIVDFNFYGFPDSTTVRSQDLKGDFQGGKIDDDTDMKKILERMLYKV